MVRETLHLDARSPAHVAQAAEILRRGGLVAFPTETVYGLGANALDPAAIARIFQAKGRPAWDPLIVHLPDIKQLSDIVTLDGTLRNRVQVLGAAFWPGPLTLLLPRTRAIPAAVTAGRALVGVRIPAHPAAQALLRATGLPLAAPSANRFGHTSPTTADHVLADLDGGIDAVLDGGPCTVGVESTVLDPQTHPMLIYRAGAITAEALAKVYGVPTELYQTPEVPEPRTATPESLPSPGVGIRHYAPEAPVTLTDGTPEALWAEVSKLQAETNPVGVLLPGDWPLNTSGPTVIQPWGRWDNACSLAAELFAGLRALELRRVRVIVCPLPEPGGIRDAIRDRLLKAARSA